MALTEPVQPEGDPASPRFSAGERRVTATPFGRLDDEHPLGRALGTIEFPASTERVLDLVSRAPGVDADQVRWLAGVLPSTAVFEGPDELAAALGRWGPPPPSTPASL